MPVVVDGCFGWLHTHPSAGFTTGDVAVMLCPALSWDALHSHHGMRLLADAFAASGYPAMRLNYPGTGDSRDVDAALDETSEHWLAWERFLNRAADWLLAATGARSLVLVGLRLGGTLAALLAQRRDDVAGLILLAPVLRGHSYIRQLTVEAQMESGAAKRPDQGLDFFELHLTSKTVERIAQVDLRHVPLPPMLKLSLFQQAPSRVIDDCVAAWTKCGGRRDQRGFRGA